MYTFQIHIKNEIISIDNQVCVNIKLPFIPQIGSVLFLSKKLIEQLENKAKSSLISASYYAPQWFYGKSSGCENPTNENLEDLSFSDAIYVRDVFYHADCELVHIELDDINIIE